MLLVSDIPHGHLRFSNRASNELDIFANFSANICPIHRMHCKHKKKIFSKISNKSVQFFNGLLENKLAIFLFPISWICYVKNFEVWCFSQLRKFDTLTATLRLALFRPLSWILTLKILYTRLITSRLWQQSTVEHKWKVYLEIGVT